MSSKQVLLAAGVLFGFWFLTQSSAEVPSATPAETRQQAQATPATEHQGVVVAESLVKRQVEAFLSHYIKTLESKDEEAIRGLFASDDRFAWFTDGKRSYSTPDEVLAGMRSYQDTRFETALSDVRVVLFGTNLASANSTFVTKLTIPGTAGHTFGGVITWLVEKDPASGAWKVLQGHTSTPGGPPQNSGTEVR